MSSKSRRVTMKALDDIVGLPKRNVNLPEHIRKGNWNFKKAEALEKKKYYMYLSKAGHRTVLKRDDVWAADENYETNKRTKKSIRVYHTGPETEFLPNLVKKDVAAAMVPAGQDGSRLYSDWDDWVDSTDEIQIRVSMPRIYLVQFLKSYNFAINDSEANKLLDAAAFGRDYKTGEYADYWTAFIQEEKDALDANRAIGKEEVHQVNERQIAVFIADSNALRTPKDITVVGQDGREVGVGHRVEISAKPHLDKMIVEFMKKMDNDPEYADNNYIDVSPLPKKPREEVVKAAPGKTAISSKNHARFGGFTYQSASTGESITVPANILHVHVTRTKEGTIGGGKNAAILALKELGLDDETVKAIANPVGVALADIAARKAESKAKKNQSKTGNIILKKGTLKGPGFTGVSTVTPSEHAIEVEDNEDVENIEEPDEVEEPRSSASSSKKSPSPSPAARQRGSSSPRTPGKTSSKSGGSAAQEELLDEDDL